MGPIFDYIEANKFTPTKKLIEDLLTIYDGEGVVIPSIIFNYTFKRKIFEDKI